jgi:hypothetical protein
MGGAPHPAIETPFGVSIATLSPGGEGEKRLPPSPSPASGEGGVGRRREAGTSDRRVRVPRRPPWLATRLSRREGGPFLPAHPTGRRTRVSRGVLVGVYGTNLGLFSSAVVPVGSSSGMTRSMVVRVVTRTPSMS